VLVCEAPDRGVSGVFFGTLSGVSYPRLR